ncbi:MAG: hypothetical protein UD961_03830 [Bacteroidales bacterium]|nr:hypothetical protein [Bacteroidales bacterium]
MKDRNMNIYLNDRYMQYQERKQSLEAMPASEGRTELLRNYIRDLEADILKIVGNPNEFSDLVKRTAPSKIREVSHMLMYRCWALNTMFYDHCSNTEIKQFAVINEHLYNTTQHMYERTNMAKDFLQTMPTHENDNDVWIESKLEFWCDDAAAVPKFAEDEYYGSDFSNMIAILSTIDRDFYHREGFDYIYPHSEIVDGKVVVIDDIVNVLDNGRSWSEGYLRHPKLSDIIICHAVHDICDHKSYSIPDLLRMNSFQVSIDIKIQSFHNSPCLR